MVDGMIVRLSGELDFEPRVVATGGVARLVASRSQCIEVVDDLLTLDGLRIINGRNERAEAGKKP